MRHENSPSAFDRVIAFGSYLTLGTIGIIWFLVNAVLLRRPYSKYLIQNLIQSFIVSILIAIMGYLLAIIPGIIEPIPFIGNVFKLIMTYFFFTPVFMTMSLINFILFIFLCYAGVVAALGRVPFIPFVTKITKQMYP